MNYITFFNEPEASELAQVGGKGANLGKMAGAGFPVPPGFCVTAAAYCYLVDVTGLRPIIDHMIRQIDFQDPAGIEVKAAQIRKLIRQQPIPSTIAEEIQAGYEQLGQMMGKTPAQNPAVAVRSSATAEDLPDASFAGQQDTYLNIRGHTSVLEHVRRCWASLWTARAITYRHQQGFDHQLVYLAVVIQAMVDPQTSGIAFTANPISGERDECVINASWGLGEAIVSGVVSPDTYIVKKRDGRITQKHIACKERLIVSTPDGGAVEIATAAHLRDIPALSERQVAELTALSSRIEAHYGSPQDIEWAHDNGRWYILQSRPITTLTEKQPAAVLPGRFSRAMFVEIFPEAISPSFLSVVSPLLAGMLDFTFRQLGIHPPQGMEAVHAFYNQPYFSEDYIEAAFSAMPPADREHLVAQFVNPFAHTDENRKISGSQMKLLARMLLYLRRFRGQLPGLLAGFRADVDALDALALEALADEEIVDRIDTLVFDGASRLLNGDFLLIALAGTFNRLLLRILNRVYADESPEVFNGLITGVTGNVIMETNKLLWDLAQSARAVPEVKEALLHQDPGEASILLRQTDAGRQLLDQIEGILDICGHREMHLDILYPTWGEDPAPVFNYIRGYLEADPQQNPAARQAVLVADREALTAEVLGRLRGSLTGRLVYAPLFRQLLIQVNHLLRERDTMHFEWTRLFPPARKLLLELGRRWTARRLLPSPEDIFYLQLDEMGETARISAPLHDLVAARRQELAENLHGPWPDTIEDGQALYRPVAAGEHGRLFGVAGSPGRITGPCRIIHGPEEFGRLKSGDILIAPLTNPVWTPLFAIAGGLVTNVGGILSHGAIVAREYGIPAVMSVSGATEHFVDGQMVMVDGNKGVVSLAAKPPVATRQPGNGAESRTRLHNADISAHTI